MYLPNMFGDSSILMDAATTKQVIQNYQARPRAFSQKQIDLIKRHASHYNIPFAEDEQSWMDHVKGVVKQAVSGYISGFTTINIGEAPQSPAEKISRAVGSLGGFIGLTPSGPVKALGALTKSQSIANIGSALAKARGSSVPLYLANKIMKKGTTVFDTAIAKQAINGTGAVNSAVKFLKNPATSNYLSRALRMGIASGISSWQGGVDQIMKSFLWGVSAGGIDATIANAIRTNSKVSEGILKGLAGSIADGLPSTLRGETTPEQIYYYLRGAYFGATEVPWTKRYAHEKILEYRKKGGDRDAFIKSLPRPVRKDFIEGINQISLTSMTEAALKESGLWGVYQKRHKEYIDAEVAKYDTELENTKAISDNGGDTGQGTPDPPITPSNRIRNVVNMFPHVWKSDLGIDIEAKTRFTNSLMEYHERTANEHVDPHNISPNYYHDRMMKLITDAGYPDGEIPKNVSYELHAIARDLENTEYTKYIVPTISMQDGKRLLSLRISDIDNNRSPNNKILGERTTSNLLNDAVRELNGNNAFVVKLNNLYAETSRGYDELSYLSVLDENSRDLSYNSNLSDRDKISIREIAGNLDKQIYNKYGLVYYSGNNAKTDAIYVPLHPEVKSIINDSARINKTFSLVMADMFNSKVIRNNNGSEFKSVKDMEDFVTNILKEDAQFSLDEAKAIFVSNVLYDMKLQANYNSINNLPDYFTKFFDDAEITKDLKSFTKRMQLIMATGAPMRKEFFRNQDRTKMNPYYNDLDNPRILLVNDAKLTDADFKIGVDLPEFAERSTDGTIFMLSEHMNDIGEYMGHGRPVGAIKSVTVAPTGPLGTILGKYAIHPAPPKLANIMYENGITHIMFSTAGKVTGLYNARMISQEDLMNNDINFLQSKIISETKWEDWKVNLGKGMTIAKAHKSKMQFPIQALSMFNGDLGAKNPGDVNIMRQEFLDTLMKKNFYGDDNANKIIDEFLNADEAKAATLKRYILNNDILDSVGRQYIGRLILDDRKVSVANEFITKILNEDIELINEKFQDGEMSQTQYEAAMQEATSDSGIINKALYASENPVSLLHNPQTAGILDKVINSYILSAAIRPKTNNALEVPISGYFAKAWADDPIMSKLNVRVDPTGTIDGAERVYKFALGNSERNAKIIRANGKTEKLGDIFDRVQERRKDPEYLAKLTETEREAAIEDAEFLRWVIFRTPHGHPSSAIVAELAGFDGLDGPRIYLDQAAMGRLGGADTDIDTVKLFTGSNVSKDGTFNGVTSRIKNAFAEFDRLAYNIHEEQLQRQIQQEQPKFNWARTAANNYEVSSRGDKTYSALYAKLKDNRTIEEAYQQAKGSGKGRPAVDKNFDYWGTYLGLWRQWAKENPQLIEELRQKASGKTLTDQFAKTENNQARALAEILNETAPQQPIRQVKKVTVRDYDRYADAGLSQLDDSQVYTLRKGNSIEQYGNPFSGSNRGGGLTIKMRSIKDSVNAYIKWLNDPNAEFIDINGKIHKNVKQEQRNWILKQIDSGALDGKILSYYKSPSIEGGKYYSHADALADFINNRRYSAQYPIRQSEEQVTIGEKTVRLIEPKNDVDEFGVPIKSKYEAYTLDASNPLASPILMYARNMRERIQGTFITGRNDLGEIANAGNYFVEAISFLKMQPDETYRTQINYNGKKVNIKYELRAPENIQNALKHYNVALNMAADITEFNGLKDPALIKDDIYGKAIKITVEGENLSPNDIARIRTSRGLFKRIATTKQVLYSRNFAANRRWTADEIKTVLDSSKDIYGDRNDTLLGAARKAILDADMDIPLITKKNAATIENLYKAYRQLPNVLGHKTARPTKAVPMTEDVKYFFDSKLYDPIELERVIDTNWRKAWTNKTIEIVLRQNNIRKYVRSATGEKYGSAYTLTVESAIRKMIYAAESSGKSSQSLYALLNKYKNNKKLTSEETKLMKEIHERVNYDLKEIENKGFLNDRFWRLKFAQEQKRRGERYIANDIYDMISAMLERKYIMEIPPELQSQIPKRVSAGIKELYDKLDYMRNVSEEVPTAAQRNITLEELYLAKKSKLTPAEQKLFDIELFSSMLWGGKGQGPGKPRGSAETRVTNIGYMLSNIPKDVIKEYNDAFMSVLTGKKEIAEIGYKSDIVKEPITQDNIYDRIIRNPDILRTPGGIVDMTALENKIVQDLVNRVIPDEIDSDAIAKVKANPQLNKLYIKEMLPEMLKLKENLIERKITDPDRILSLIRGMTGTMAGGRVGKDLNALTLEEVKMVNRAFKFLEEPQLLVKIFGRKSINYPILRRLYYYLIPTEIGREQMRFVWDTKQSPGKWANKYGKAFVGTVEVPTSAIDTVSEYINTAQSLATKARETMVTKVGEELMRYTEHPMFPELFDIAVVLREHSSLKTAINNQINMPSKTKARHLKELDSLYMSSRRKLAQISKEHPQMQIKVSNKNGKDVIVDLTPYKIVENINDIVTNTLKDVFDNVIAEKDAVQKYARRFKDGPRKGQIIYIRNPKTKRITNIPAIDKDMFMADMQKSLTETGEWGMDFGIDGLRLIAHSILYQSRYSDRFGKINVDDANSFLNIADKGGLTTLKWVSDGYFPHIYTSRTRFQRDINEYIKDVEDDRTMKKSDKDKAIKKYIADYVKNGSNVDNELDVDHLHRYGDMLDEIMARKDKAENRHDSKLKYLDGISRSGNQMHREYFSLGYDRTLNSLYKYIGNMTSVYYRNMSQILSRIKIADFTKEMAKNYDDKTANNWRYFMHLYAQGAAGYGVTIPPFLAERPEMKLKGTLYHLYSDSEVLRRMNNMTKKMGIQDKISGKFTQQDLANFSALEAKYSLATLLSRPKSMVANMIGGSLNTAISTGFGPLLRAQQLKELHKAHPEFKTIEDWHRFAVQKGVVEDMFLNELEGGRYAGNVDLKRAISMVVKKLAHDPNLDDKSLMQIVKSAGVSEALFQKAGWFMRTAERKLRLDAFFAHYLQQYDNMLPYLNGNTTHSALQFDSPILIKMAKEGIKATQYLYSAPFRPMFSSSSLGKIMTRFQMYAFNSVDYRKNIMNAAGTYGFNEGTKDFDRMQRLILADMISLAAANAFMYSVFDNNLPAPWTWLQDFANWLFGDERERDRAFYGAYPATIAPLQIFTPPSARMVGPVINGMIENDFSKIANYTLWTMFPFGPFGLDIKKSLENPVQSIDQMFGIPLRGAGTVAATGVNIRTGKQWKKAEVKKQEQAEKEKKKQEKLKTKKRARNNRLISPLVPIY